MSVKDVCALVGRSDRTIRNWIKTGHLKPHCVGRSVFFHRADIEALLGLGDAKDGPAQDIQFFGKTEE